jgi:hypothetical protein
VPGANHTGPPQVAATGDRVDGAVSGDPGPEVVRTKAILVGAADLLDGHPEVVSSLERTWEIAASIDPREP